MPAKTDIYKEIFSDDNAPDLDATEENFYLIPTSSLPLLERVSVTFNSFFDTFMLNFETLDKLLCFSKNNF